MVIVGALFKILHLEFGSELLAIGLITEAIIFAISAFEPVDEEYDWTLVFPQLAGGESGGRKNEAAKAEEAEGLLSRKLDELLKEAHVDAQLMGSLREGIRNFEEAAKGIAPTGDAIQSTKRYSDELSRAATQLESLNSLYKIRLESARREASINEEVVQNASALKDQMESLASNLSSLNGVYGSILTAMNRN